jgi:hypothetical protein
LSSNITMSRACEPTLCAVFPHRASNLNITFNARQILENSIRVKSQKCTKLAGHVPLWLALFNDYWLPSNDTNMLAFASMNLLRRRTPKDRVLAREHAEALDGWQSWSLTAGFS